MRDFLTLLAGLLVVVLTAALAGPYLVDWTGQRVFLEQRLSAALGARVGIEGPVSLTLLPTPSLDVGSLTVESEGRGGAALRSERAEFELGIAPLMRGELQFIKADLERPVLRLSAASDGSIVLPGAPDRLPRQINFESVALHDATIQVDKAGSAAWVLKHIDLTARADSLAGPFSGEGFLRRAADEVHFSFQAGSRTDEGLPLQATVGVGKASLNLNGTIRLTQRGAATRIGYVGAADSEGDLKDFGGLPDLTWSVAGTLEIDSAGFALDKGSVRLGPDKGAIEAQATAKSTFAAGSRIAVSIKANEFDADRLLASLGPDGGRKLEQAATDFLAEGGTPPPLDITLATPILTLGSQSLTNFSFAAGLRATGEIRTVLKTRAPGDADVSWDGVVRTGANEQASGKLDVSVGDLARFASWIKPTYPGPAQRLQALPLRALAAKDDFTASATGWQATNLVLTADGDVLKGSAAFSPQSGFRRARIDLDLHSDALDIGSLPDLRALRSQTAGVDLALALDARAVRVDKFGQGVVDAGKIALHLHMTPAIVRLDDLSLADLGGANLTASGDVTDRGAHFDAVLDASRLGDLAEAIRRVAPGRLALALVDRADALSPARLSFHAEALRQANGTYRPTSLSLTGSAGGAGIVASAERLSTATAVSLDLHADESAVLMRQLGFETLPIDGARPGAIQVRGALEADGNLVASLSAELAGSAIHFSGSVVDWATRPKAAGAFSFQSADAIPFLSLSTLAELDPSTELPLSISAHAVASAQGLELTDAGGAVAGDDFTGSLSLSLDEDAGLQAAGDVSFVRLDMPGLLRTVLGSAGSAHAGVWEKAAFAPGLATWPDSNFVVHAEHLALAPGWSGEKAGFRLMLGSDSIGLHDFAMRIDGGSVSGSLDARRNGASVAATAHVGLQSVGFVQPWFRGKMTGSASWAASGASEFELVQGLAGSGSVRVDDLTVERTSPDALSRLLADEAKQDDDASSMQQIDQRLTHDLDAGPFVVPFRQFDVAAAGGRLRLTTAPPGTPNPSSITVDLLSLATSERIDVSAAGPKDWPDPSGPLVSVLWSAPAPAATAIRTIQADTFVADLAARAASREAARIQVFNQDIQERAFFERRMKGLEFMRRRRAEVAAWKDEQRRLKAAEAAAAALQAQAARPASGTSQAATERKSPASRPSDGAPD